MRPVSESFKARADTGAFWEAWVGTVLARAGLYTLHYPLEVDDKDHSLSHDLDVFGLHPDTLIPCMGWDSGKEQAPIEVEIKSRNLTFTSVQDYPFEFCNVCSWSNFRKKYPASDKVGRDFLFVSQVTGAILWLPKGTRIEVTEGWDGERQESFKLVQAPASSLRPLQEFVELVKG